jgi:hypothetical protein
MELKKYENSFKSLYNTILSVLLVISVTILTVVVSNILNQIYTDRLSPAYPVIEQFVANIIPIIVVLSVVSFIIKLIAVIAKWKAGSILYSWKKFNKVLYNLLLLIILNMGYGILEIQGLNILILGVAAILFYIIPGYLIIDSLYKIVLQDVYMALKSEFIAHEVGL